jgi:hypothetical protein
MIDQNLDLIRADTIVEGVQLSYFLGEEMQLQHDLIRLPTPQEKAHWGSHVVHIRDGLAQPLVGPVLIELDYKWVSPKEAWDFLGRHGGQFPAIVLFRNDQRASI